MQCYTELVPPTTVTHAVTLPFLSANEENLVVAKTSLLQVFRLRTNATDNDAGEEEEEGDQAIDRKLSLVGEYKLSGIVTALQRVKILYGKSGGEALLVSSKDAKLSLVDWDPENHRINTISIHYYEGESIPAQPFGPALKDTESILTVDPSSRCAALKFGQRHLAILPFRQQGDDLADLEAEADNEDKRQPQQNSISGDAAQTPYKASFVSTLTQVSPNLTHPQDLAFLYEYREPTLGIIASASQASSALLDLRRDIMTYTVGTLDLEQRASTVLVSVPNLPSDLWKVVPLSLPVGGALLIGTNEFVHVDQSGKTTAIAVNEFAAKGSDFAMADHSSLGLKLEDCVVEPLNNAAGDLLIALRDGSLTILRFTMQGRHVGGMQIVKVTDENGGLSPESAPSCIAAFQSGEFLIGSDVGDSILLQSNNPPATISRKRSHAQMASEDDDKSGDDDEDDDAEEDDLYGGAPAAAQKSQATSAAAASQPISAYSFHVIDRLPSMGPINDFCFGRAPQSGNESLDALASVGRGRGSRLAFLRKQLVPEFGRRDTIDGAKNVWSIAASKNANESNDTHDNILFVYDGENTKAYSRPEAEDQASNDDAATSPYAERTDVEFEQEGETIDIGTLAHRTRIVQCRQNEIRTYDADLALSQIIPMIDEETEEELKIAHTSFCDPYLLVLRDDSSVQILRVEKNGDVEPLEPDDTTLTESKWLGGCAYSGSLTRDQAVIFLLREDGSLHAFSLPELKPIFTAPNLSHLPPILYTENTQRRVGARETLTEIIVADIGPTDASEPYLILRSATDTFTIYEPFRYPANNASGSWHNSLRFRKVPTTHVPKFDITDDGSVRISPLRPTQIAGYNAVSVSGGSPSLITKHATSLPQIVGLRAENCRAFTPLHVATCARGFAVLDVDGNLQECTFPADAWFGTGWVVRKLPLGNPIEEVRQLAYHESRGLYVVATCRLVDFMFVEEDGRHPEQDDIAVRPQVPQYTLHLLSAKSHRVLHSMEMPYTETITTLKVMPLEASELTHEQKSLVVVGSAQQRGEDMPAKGALTVLEILDVVPEPNDEETGVKLHVVSREEPRGAVTAVETFLGGLIGTAQGQKLMVRGLKEDGSCLPVAFLDAQCQMVTLKTFARSGMWLGADVWKGLWFGAFTEEPYKLSVLGKSRTQMEVVCAEFLPADDQLFILVVDADMDLHVLQYDPENPKSLSGTRLLHRSTFHLGHFPSTMTLVPSTLAPFTEQQEPLATAATNGGSPTPTPQQQHQPLFHVLITTQTGSIGLVTPVDESTYRRLGAVEAHLTSILEHAAGLNPREFRAVDSEGFGARGVVDGGLVQRISELGSTRRAEVLGRAGGDAWVLRSDLEILGGGGLGWL
jgi:cleavage and polyadenylation specificity factor subunit 1